MNTRKEVKNMKTTYYVVALSLLCAASFVSVTGLSITAAYAESDLLAKCHWYKQQAFKLKTDAAWITYYDCMRGRL